MRIRDTRDVHAHAFGHVRRKCLCDGCVLMRSNKDGNDRVHFSLPFCFTRLSRSLPGTQLLVYIKPKRIASLKSEKNNKKLNMQHPFADSAQIHH